MMQRVLLKTVKSYVAICSYPPTMITNCTSQAGGNRQSPAHTDPNWLLHRLEAHRNDLLGRAKGSSWASTGTGCSTDIVYKL